MSEVHEDSEAGGVGGRRGVGGKVEGDGFAGSPVGGDLQDGGAAEAAVGDEHLFAEGASHRSGLRVGSTGKRSGRNGRYDFGGDAGEVAPVGVVLGVEDEGDEAGTRLHDGVAE